MNISMKHITTLLGMLLAIAFAGNASADAYLGAIGGDGGGQFQARCAGSELLVGFALRTGDDVDAIRPLCVTAYGPRQIGAIPYTVGDGRIEKYRDATREVYGNHQPIAGDWWELESGWNGGVGGGIHHIVCPTDQPIVTGMFVGAEGVDTVIVNNIHLFCGVAADTQVASDHPAAIFDAPAYKASKAMFGIGSGGSQPYRDGNTQHCPAGQVAIGVHGRSGVWLDAIGLICGRPTTTVRSIGRVSPRKIKIKTSTGQLSTTTITRSSETAALASRSTSATQVDRSAGYSVISARQAGNPVPPPPPIVVEPAPAVPVVFRPPLLQDGGQLWACVDAAAGEIDAGACSGAESAQAYCQLRGARNGPDLIVAEAQPGTPVRAVNGDVCSGETCRVVSELQCDH